MVIEHCQYDMGPLRGNCKLESFSLKWIIHEYKQNLQDLRFIAFILTSSIATPYVWNKYKFKIPMLNY